MSVYFDKAGNMVITVRTLDEPAQDYVALRTALINVVQCKNPDIADSFSEYRVLELVKDLELTDEQAKRIFE